MHATYVCVHDAVIHAWAVCVNTLFIKYLTDTHTHSCKYLQVVGVVYHTSTAGVCVLLNGS